MYLLPRHTTLGGVRRDDASELVEAIIYKDIFKIDAAEKKNVYFSLDEYIL